MAIDIEALKPSELFQLKKRLCGMLVFGPWTRIDGSYQRREAESTDQYLCGIFRSANRDGWHYYISTSVVNGITGAGKYATQALAMAACDEELLRACDQPGQIRIVLVDPMSKAKE